MKLDLSSQIEINKIDQKFYRPENEYELSKLTQYEKITTKIYESSVDISLQIAEKIAECIRARQKVNQNFVLGLSAEYTFQTIYKALIRKHKEDGLSFQNVVVFNLYEFYSSNSQSDASLKLIKSLLLDHIDIKPENIHSPSGLIKKEKIFDICRSYEQQIEKYGGIDCLLLGLGDNGTMGLNITGSSLNSQTRLVVLNQQSRKEAVNAFGSLDKVPSSAITMGISTILKAKEIILVAFGEGKSKSVFDVVEEGISESVPASLLQNHQNTLFYIDLNAAYELTRINRPWLVSNCDWNSKLIRRAIVWLCQKLKKPILKLINKDYQDNGLEELLSLYGSAYNVNKMVFNNLQKTITGWPGGKPSKKDSNVTERGEPFPKKVIIFSPHPDDDVISMGGTFKRLVDQGHDVHVAYQTSGNIAVGDEDTIRYVSLLLDTLDKYNPENIKLKQKFSDILQFLMNKDKNQEEGDTADVLFIKGHIRRQEALTGCRYVGLNDKKACFLDLPFYETGKIAKNPISEADVMIIKNYLSSIKPQEIFVAGDLADPHGTHKVCLDAILAAVDELKDAEWLKKCHIWMYRGAWQEWEIENIEMAVPISPEELRFKRDSILKHQSQMENAPFLGGDDRLFWQRAEERNRTTAELYHQLGLAWYEAMEAFVEYKHV